MATESPLIHDGSQTVSARDMRNSTVTGTTLLGPNGSGQFLAVALSTSVARTIDITTASGQKAYGVLQNKPAVGEAADVGIFGVSMMLGASTAIEPGSDLMAASSGAILPYSSAAGAVRLGRSLTFCSAVGEVFTGLIYGGAMGGGSIA